MHRYPLEPLAQRLGITLHEPGNPRLQHPGHRPDISPPDGDGPNGLALLAERVGISYSTAKRYMNRGLTDWAADRCAIAVGRHPSEIWPAWWANALGDELDPEMAFADDPPMIELGVAS